MRLLAGTSLATVAVLALLGTTIYLSVRHAMLSEFDAALRATSNALASMTEQTDHGIRFEAALQQMPEFTAGHPPAYYESWMSGGRVLARSPTLGTRDLPATASASGAVYSDMVLPDGHPGRSLTLSFAPASDADEEAPRTAHAPASQGNPLTVRLTVARPTRDLDRSLARLRWLLLLCCGGATAASGVVLLLVVRVALRPVNRVAREIQAIGETDLDRRVAAAGVPEELRPVVQRLNELLDRLGGAFARERAFTADVAHELRTPLSGLQATLDVCRSRPRSTVDYETAIDKCQSMIRQMRAMVENLLTLARAEAGQLGVVRTPVDLCLLLQECWIGLAGRADGRSLKVEWDLPSECAVETDPEKLRIVVQNLLENAVTYTEESGRIRISIASEIDQRASLQVSNTGSQLAPEDASRVFQRFWRGDASRTFTGVRCGLGLSLCQRLITLLGGTIGVEILPQGIFQAKLFLPAASRAETCRV